MLGHMVILCLTYRGTTKLFSTVAAPFYIPTNSVRGSRFLHILSNTYFPFRFIMAILVVVRWCLILILICISLMTDDVEQLFMYLLAIYIALEKCPFQSIVHFLIGFVFSLSCKSSLCLLILHPYQIHDLCVLSFIIWAVSSLC